MGPTWDRQGPGGPHVGPMNLGIWDGNEGPTAGTSNRYILCIFASHVYIITPTLESNIDKAFIEKDTSFEQSIIDEIL